MAFASFDGRGGSMPMSEINMVPLIDVMLVMLVIFIVTAPLLTHSVKLELPKASASPEVSQAAKIQFAIDAAGQRYWNGERVTREQAAERFAVEGQREPQPEIHLSTDQAAQFKAVAETLADASKAGMTKIGFLSEPDRR